MNPRSKHAEFAARTFCLSINAPSKPEPAALPLPNPGESVAVIGPSGAGKTVALRHLCEARDAVEVARLRCDELDTPILELFPETLPSAQVLRVLASVGLADGRLWGMRAGYLSAGECRRLEIARALCTGTKLIVVDEFDAHLDATTACLLAQNLRRLAGKHALRLVVSTHRPEALAYLASTRVVEIDRGLAQAGTAPESRDLLTEIEFTRGRLRDYQRFAQWHYLGPGRPGPTSDVFLASHKGRAVGIAVFGYPHLFLSARTDALPEFSPARIRRHGAQELNRSVRLLQRVVVEPRYRGIGIARALIRHALHGIDASTVECVAQMGEFSGFLSSAGFRSLGKMRTPESVKRLTDFLHEHRIDTCDLLSPDRRKHACKRLSGKEASMLLKLISRLAQSRIQTGFGALRRSKQLREPIIRKALSRLHAQPSYYLWRRSEP